MSETSVQPGRRDGNGRGQRVKSHDTPIESRLAPEAGEAAPEEWASGDEMQMVNALDPPRSAPAGRCVAWKENVIRRWSPSQDETSGQRMDALRRNRYEEVEPLANVRWQGFQGLALGWRWRWVRWVGRSIPNCAPGTGQLVHRDGPHPTPISAARFHQTCRCRRP